MPPPAGTAKNWAAYRARFVEPMRIRAGVGVLARQRDAGCAQAEEVYGVPPEIVVGIIGVETIYGQQMGNFRVIDALATLAFDFPAGRKDRSAFFRDELESCFVLCQQRGPRSAAPDGQLRRRDRHAAVHAVELQQVRGRLRRRRPRRPARQRRRRDRQRRATTSPSSAGSAACRRTSTSRAPVDASRPRGAARARHPAELHAPPSWPQHGAALAADAALRLRRPARARRTAERRRRAELRRRHDATSTRSRATTGRATTRWR